MSGAVDEKGNPKYYDEQKINRITLLYDFYVDTLLKTMQLLYYEIISQPDLYLFCDTVTGLLKTQYVNDENNIQYNEYYNIETEQIIQDSLELEEAEKKKKEQELNQIPVVIHHVVQEEAKEQPKKKDQKSIETQTKEFPVKETLEYQSLKGKKKKYKEQLDEIQKQKDSLLSEIADKDSKIKQFKEKSSKNESQISDKQHDLEQAKQKWKTKKSSLKKQISEKDSQQRSDKIHYEKAIREKENQLNDIIEAMQAIKQENTNEKEKLKKSKMSESEMKQELQQQQIELQQLRELQSEKQRLETQIRELNNEVRELRFDKDVVHENMLQINNDLSSKLQMADDLLKKQQNSGSIIQSDFQNQLQIKDREMQKLRQEIETITQEKSRIQMEIESQIRQSKIQMDNQIQSKIKEMDDSFKQQVNDQQNKIQEQGSQLAAYQNQIVQYENNAFSNQQIIQNYEQREEQMQYQISLLNNQIQNMDLNKKFEEFNIDDRISQLTRQLEEFSLENENYKNQNRQLQEQLSNSQRLIQEKDNSIQQQKSMIQDDQNKISKLESSYVRNVNKGKFLLFALQEEDKKLVERYNLNTLWQFINDFENKFQTSVYDIEWSDLLFQLEEYAKLNSLGQDILNQQQTTLNYPNQNNILNQNTTIDNNQYQNYHYQNYDGSESRYTPVGPDYENLICFHSNLLYIFFFIFCL
ncbi:hypothetical protein ABPG72_019792 [Tetrahymena utriculariae]